MGHTFLVHNPTVTNTSYFVIIFLSVEAVAITSGIVVSAWHNRPERVVVAAVDDFGILRGIAERACRTRYEQVADGHAHVAQVVGEFVAFCAGIAVLLGFEPCKGAGGIRDVALLNADA